MSGLKTLYNLLLKDTVKGSGQASGIMSIGDSVRKLAKRKFEAYVATAQRQGVDLDKLSEEQIKYMLELNKPKAPKVHSNEEAYEILSRFANQNKTGKVIKADFGKPFKEEIGSVDNIINDITRMEPIAAMKEVNKVLGKKGKYKNLSKQDSEKIFKDTGDWINQRDPADLYDYKNKRPFREDPNFDPDDPDFNPEDMAQGGRAGFKIGSINKARRAFLKTVGAVGAGIGALKTGILGLTKGAAGKKAVEQVVTTPPVAGKPAWFDAVVNRVIAEGDDVTKQFAYKERMQVNTKQISPTEEVTVYRDLDDGSVRINYGEKMRKDETKPYERGNISRASNEPTDIDLIVREGVGIEPSIVSGPMKGKAGRKTEASFEASEAEPRSVGGPEDADIEFDGIREVDNVDDLMQDVSTLEEFGTGKKLTGDKAAKAKKKREDYQRFTEDQMEQAEYLETKYGPYDDSAMDDFASGGIARMLGE